MTDYSAFPDSEAALGRGLRDAGVCDGRVYSSMPTKPVFPLVLIRRVAGIPVERRRLDRARLQIDAYGANQADARDAAEAARIAAHRLEGTTVGDCFFAGIEDELGLTRLPDRDTGRDRYTFAIAAYTHS